MKGTRIVVVLLVVMTAVLVYGLMARRGSLGAGQGGAQVTGPPPTPGPLAGEYALASAKLSKPFWRDPCGTLVSRGLGGVLEGSINPVGHPVKGRLQYTGEGAALKADLTLDLDGNGQLNEKPVAGGPATAWGQEGVRVVFPAVKGSDGTSFTVGAEVRRNGQVTVANIQRILTEYLAAKPAAGKPDPKLRFLPANSGAKPAAAYWLDTDGDGAASASELAASEIAGIEGYLYVVSFSGAGPAKVALAGFPTPAGTLQLTATDAGGKPTQVRGISFNTPRGSAEVPGLVSATEVPAGGLLITYGIPVSAEVTARASVLSPTRVPSGSTAALKVGGPISIKLDVSSGSGNVMVTANLATATGDSIRAFTGPGEHSGLVEVLDGSGKVLADGKLEFG